MLTVRGTAAVPSAGQAVPQGPLCVLRALLFKASSPCQINQAECFVDKCIHYANDVPS